MKCFNIPGIESHYMLNIWFLGLMKDHPEYFYSDVKISSVFGNFQYCIWDGGRNFVYYHQVTKEDMLDIKQAYDHFQIALRFIFTNPILEEKHLYNRFCNLQLELFHEDKNEIVVNSPLLEEYIRKNYPKYKIISSTTKRLNKSEEFLKELNNPNYYQVCLDYDLNKNEELINSIPKELREKCEFLINAICPAKCPQRKIHYTKNGLAHLSYLKNKYVNTKCQIKDNINHPNVLGKGNNFSFEEIDKYNKMGYKYFKIEGRTLHSLSVLLNYLYYMVKPEWRAELIEQAYLQEGIIINSLNGSKYQIIEDRKYIIGE